MMTSGSGQLLSVPPGFRFHPTEEELLYYYLRKKVSYQAIDLQVIREVDLNKIEPWDLKDKCRIGTCPQNDFYFFSHKDKKYPTGTRTNRATTVGFWKATGRDKSIHLTNSKRIGMRKTLVFYTGRAPHGHKTDWIMHEYRLDDHTTIDIQENGWVVCRVFMKKNHYRGFQQDVLMEEEEEEDPYHRLNNVDDHFQTRVAHERYQPLNTHAFLQYPTNYKSTATDFAINPSGYVGSTQLELPQLLIHDHQPHIVSAPSSSPLPPVVHSNSFINRSLNIDPKVVKLRSISSSSSSAPVGGSGGGDWCFLEKLLANNHPNQNQQEQLLLQPSSQALNNNNNGNKLPLHYLGCEAEMFMKYPK